MKPPLPFLLAAAAVFLGSALFYAKRAAEHPVLGHMGIPATHRTVAHLPAPGAAAVAPTPNNIAPPPVRPAPSPGALVDRVEQKLLATANPKTLADLTAWTDDVVLAAMKRAAGLTDEECAKVKAHLAAARLERQRNSLRTDLTPADRIATQAELNRADDAWLKEFLGEERFAQYGASKEAKRRADAEAAVSRGLGRISRAVPLRPEQKDALYTGLLAAAMDPAAEARDPLVKFQITSAISEEPSRPSLQEEAKTVLSPEQWAQYEEQSKISAEGQNKMQEHLMSMLPVLLTSLQELMDESAAAEKTR